jgi:hypothetical protein
MRVFVHICPDAHQRRVTGLTLCHALQPVIMKKYYAGRSCGNSDSELVISGLRLPAC